MDSYISAIEIIISLLVFWSLALSPPLFTRFLILKRPASKLFSWIFVVIFFFFNYSAQYYVGIVRQELQGGGPPDPKMIGLFLMGWATFAMLRLGKEKTVDISGNIKGDEADEVKNYDTIQHKSNNNENKSIKEDLWANKRMEKTEELTIICMA